MTAAEPRTTRDLATDLVVLGVIEDKVKARKAQIKAQLAGQVDVGDRKTAQAPDGQKLGSVTYTNGRAATAYVTDEAMFTRWVAEQYPTEVETVTRVRPAYQARLLKEVSERGAPVDGEGVFIPGLDMGDPGTPYLTVRKAEDAEAIVTALWQAGVLSPLHAIEAAS